MDIMAIFGTQFVLSVVVFALIARWYVSPWLAEKGAYAALAILVIPHAFRHLGLLFLAPPFVGANLDAGFANMAAYGDLAAGLLAIAALLALRAEMRVAIPVVWVFNIVGSVDLVNALSRAQVVSELGITLFIPTFIVPVLLVTHAMIFTRLIHERWSSAVGSAVSSH